MLITMYKNATTDNVIKVLPQQVSPPLEVPSLYTRIYLQQRAPQPDLCTVHCFDEKCFSPTGEQDGAASVSVKCRLVPK